MFSSAIRYLIVPGWQGSPAEHWQSHWQRVLPNARRVEQADWQAPQLRDWVWQLQQDILEDDTPVLLIAHSLGCITVAHWAAQASPEARRLIAGALLVAPADVERQNCPAALRNFAPIPRQPLPFPVELVGSSNDPAMSEASLLQLAHDWQAQLQVLDGVGHINVASGHQRWEQGFAWLYRLQSRFERAARRRA